MNGMTRPSDEEIKRWQIRLVGKYVLDPQDSRKGLSENQIIRSSILPSPNQILPPGAPQLRNYIPGRMNVFLDDTKKVTQVYFG
ncbi:hypothetical protein BC941DRAFT_473851 [Chlamydoabsidia padenii]|nr:hypothetical protein BC941DRAFT_473851 [Chlamydoabsidia padenii]